MKKITLSLAFAFLGTSMLLAQETTENTATRQNDIMISPIELIAIPAVNVSYERLLNEDNGIGINGIFYVGNDDEEVRFSQISPYYRAYFGKKYASGFFVEGFLPITMTKEYVYNYNEGVYASERLVDETTFGVGVGFGGKWVAKRNIIFEASAGIARRFGGDSGTSEITGKGMLGIGYRF